MAEVINRVFASGEITPDLYARVDNIKYATGLRTCRNFLVKRHGGAENRPGTEFIMEARGGGFSSPPGDSLLVPFVFNTDQTYVLVFTHYMMEVIKNGVHLTSASIAITGITNADPAVVTTSGAHGMANGNRVSISGVVGMTEVNGRTFEVKNVTATTFEITRYGGTNIDSTGYGVYTSGGIAATIYSKISPYQESDLPNLRYTQSADVMVLVHPNHPPTELTRSGHTSWTFTTMVFAPSIGTTLPGTNWPGGTAVNLYYVTALTEFGEESIVSPHAPTNTAATTGAPVIITWTPVAGANSYNIYRVFASGTGLIGEGYIGSSSRVARFDDDAIVPDFERSYPVNDNPFSGANDYPAATTFYQGRLIFANTNNLTETVWMSHSGSRKNFSIPFPSNDASRVTFSLAGRQVNSIEHMTDIGNLVMLTNSGEWAVKGNDAGIITPTDINPRQYSYNGTGSIRPIVVNGNVLYVQSRGTVVRDLLFDIEVGGYRGNDLSLFSSHLFDEFTIRDWAYQKIPNSIVYAVRSDGVLLSLTYIREQNIFGWARHDFDGGEVRNITAVPEGNEDAVYMSINRVLDDGREHQYIERFATRKFDDIREIKIMDSSLSYDGRNTGIDHMTMDNGTTWAYDETIDCYSQGGSFTAADVGNQVHFNPGTVNEIRFTIETYLTANRVQGKPHKTVPTDLRGIGTKEWAKAVDTLGGLWHIEGKQVSVLADGFVASSPNNPSSPTLTVTNGEITLSKHHSVVHVGLPITSDVQTLDIDSVGAEPLADKKKNITRVAAYTVYTRGLWAGESPPSDDSVDALENLMEFRPRLNESQELPPDLKTETSFVNIKGRWNLGGRVFIRQIDPLPATITAIIPSGYIPGQRG